MHAGVIGEVNLFERLTSRLSDVLGRLTGIGLIRESHVREAMRDIRRALLEADVSIGVVKELTASIAERALGEKVLGSLKPGQQIVKIVHDEITEILGGADGGFVVPGNRPLVVLLMGLQGSGKTTTAAKLARWFGSAPGGGERSILVAADLRRPAAAEQLRVMAERSGALFHSTEEAGGPDLGTLIGTALRRVGSGEAGVAVIDTAGRLHVDREMLDELAEIRDMSDPGLSLLVLDGLSGQDALNVAREFDENAGFDAAVLTKMDGDSRGGAALSFRAVTGKPIAFVGTGEGPDGLEPFDPSRMSGRILGMGDVVALVEKARRVVDEKEAVDLLERAGRGSFTLDDFVDQIRKLRKMGSLADILAMLPRGSVDAGLVPDDGALARMEAMICSMTPGERRRPDIIDGSRRRRIARGSGTTVSEVNRLLRDFVAMRKMLKRGMTAGRDGRQFIRRIWR